MIPFPVAKRSYYPVFELLQTKLCPALAICKKSIGKSHSRDVNGLQRRFRVKNDIYGGAYRGADHYKNDTLSRNPNPNKMIPCTYLRTDKCMSAPPPFPG